MLAAKTGCTEFHSSLRGKEKTKMDFLYDSFKDSEESFMNNVIDSEEVEAIINILN